MTIKDIARLAGCGVATVSRVLNYHPDVSEETRQRVLAVVEEQGFQPNTNAKHLKQQAGTGVSVLVKGNQNMLFADLVERAQALLRDRGWDAAVYYLDEEDNEVSFARRLCLERKPLGLLFLGGNLEFFQAGFGSIPIPAVLLTSSAQGLDFPNLSSLTTDDEQAAARIIDYLVSRGHRRVGVVGGSPSGSQVSRLRLQGCQAGLARHGLPFDLHRQYEPCRYSMTDAYTAAGRLLDREPDLTAIFALSDLIALGVIRALADRGKSVPGDVSVAGCDGIALSRYCVPRLTTIQQDTARLARQGVDLLLASLPEKAPAVHQLVPFRLVEGESVADLKR